MASHIKFLLRGQIKATKTFQVSNFPENIKISILKDRLSAVIAGCGIEISSDKIG